MPQRELVATKEELLASIIAAQNKLAEYKREQNLPAVPSRQHELFNLLEDNKRNIFGTIKKMVDDNFFGKRIAFTDLHPSLYEFLRKGPWDYAIIETARHWFKERLGDGLRVGGDPQYGSLYLDIV